MDCVHLFVDRFVVIRSLAGLYGVLPTKPGGAPPLPPHPYIDIRPAGARTAVAVPLLSSVHVYAHVHAHAHAHPARIHAHLPTPDTPTPIIPRIP